MSSPRIHLDFRQFSTASGVKGLTARPPWSRIGLEGLAESEAQLTLLSYQCVMVLLGRLGLGRRVKIAGLA